MRDGKLQCGREDLICLCHGGGFLPYQAGRFLHAFDVRAEPKARLRGSPQDSLARLHYDTIVHARS